ncbi:Mlc1 protein [Starmerella bacillaris]|uniref:Mlc1 protein n=1 Tax=Starmerella bacillaris TaxID=1247836 RepID=A0AAV5RF89_STABA|nr:Mlc1 protein [Starmerella bacillaris]
MSTVDEKTFKDAFALYDRKGDGQIPREKLGDMLRAVGQNPTQAEVAELSGKLANDTFSYTEFTDIVNRPNGFKSVGDLDDYIRGFQVFDKAGTGKIGVGELKYILTSMGESLSEAEVSELFEGLSIGRDGSVDYVEFVKSLIAQ